MSSDTIEGNAWRFGTDIDTDVIIPSQYMRLTPEEYTPHIFEPVRPEFAETVEPGDIIVAETNFGIGSSREHAAIGLKRLGVGAIIAASYGRIFYRNAVNQGLPVLECDADVPKKIDEGDELELEPFSGELHNVTTWKTYKVEPITDHERSYIEAGGAVEFFKQS